MLNLHVFQYITLTYASIQIIGMPIYADYVSVILAYYVLSFYTGCQYKISRHASILCILAGQRVFSSLNDACENDSGDGNDNSLDGWHRPSWKNFSGGKGKSTIQSLSRTARSPATAGKPPLRHLSRCLWLGYIIGVWSKDWLESEFVGLDFVWLPLEDKKEMGSKNLLLHYYNFILPFYPFNP